MFFWLHAARLLNAASKVACVSIEHDQAAAGVDDVAVYSTPGIDAGGRDCAADYDQVKYHVDQSSEYAALTFCDPTFINSGRSLLQRFQCAMRFLRRDGVNLERTGYMQPHESWSELRSRHERAGLGIDAYTTVPRWYGERLDYGLAVEMLLQVAPASEGVPAGT